MLWAGHNEEFQRISSGQVVNELVSQNISESRSYLQKLFCTILIKPCSVVNYDHYFHALVTLSSNLPPCLRPTDLALHTPHSIYIDLLPSPTLRDRLICAGPDVADRFINQACTIVLNIEDNGQLQIWGDDILDETSWEFSGEILARWGTGAAIRPIDREEKIILTDEWRQRANFWRERRGLPLIKSCFDT